MRKFYSLLLSFIALSAMGQTTFYTQSFESTTGYSFPNGNGGSAQDFFDRTDSAGAPPQEVFTYNSFDGSYFIAAEDINGAINSDTGVVYIDNINISGKSGLQFTGAFASGTDVDIDDSGDAIWVEVKIDNGSWVEIGRFEADPNTTSSSGFNGQFAEDTDGDGDGDGTLLDGTFTDFSWPISGSGDSLDVRVSFDINSGDEEGALDNIRIAENASTPNPPSTPVYNIADINNVDTNGVADSLNVTCFTQGLVLGVDLNSGGGYSFTLWDGEGIGVYNGSDVNGYTVQEGDSIIIRGTVGQFNGLTQLGSIDSISVVNTGNALPSPAVITALDESTESKLVRFDNAEITADLGFGNWEAVSGMDTITMRIETETDVDDSVSVAVGDSLCYIIGIGGQFDGSSPYTEGYQMIPRYFADIDTTCGSSSNPPAPTGTPFYNIADINNVDANGVADSVGVECFTKGIVLGVNLRTSGYQFTLWDNEGIGVFSFSDVNGYTVQEGDSIIIKGEVDQYNGLTQMGSIDSIHVVNSGNPLPSPSVVTSLDESTESEPIQINNVLVTDVDGSGSNFEIVNAADDTMTMRIDTETGIFNDITPAVGDSLCSVIGIGGQFDGSSPYTSGYQIFPMYSSDLDTTCGGVTPPAVDLNIYPIGDVTTVDANGELDSSNVVCGVQGVVTTINFSTSGGYSLFIQDQTGGINVFNYDEKYNNIDPLMGDSILVWGTIISYNGLAEIEVDSLEVLNTGNTIPDHQLVNTIDESVEGELVEIQDYVVTALDSQNVGDAINYTVVKNTDTLTVRVLNITGINDMTVMVPGDTLCSAKGAAGQFDQDSPYLENYQLQPVQMSDLTVNNCDSTGTSIGEVGEKTELRAYPNPTNNMLNFNKTIDFVMFNALGEEVKRATRVRRINVSDLTNGIYFIKSEDTVLKVIVK